MSLASRRNNIAWKKDKFGDGNPNFNGGRYVDDKGYIRVLCPDHPFNNKGYIYEHRLVAEAILGRYLQSWETVHHINEIKIDNRWENFYLTTIPEHSSIHREGKKQNKERRKNTSDRAKKRAKTGKRNNLGRFEKIELRSDTLIETELENNIQ
jgi:hypothetical protein